MEFGPLFMQICEQPPLLIWQRLFVQFLPFPGMDEYPDWQAQENVGLAESTAEQSEKVPH